MILAGRQEGKKKAGPITDIVENQNCVGFVFTNQSILSYAISWRSWAGLAVDGMKWKLERELRQPRMKCE